MEIVEMIRDFGVSIGVLVWFMFRMEKRMEKVADTLTKLTEAINGGGK